MTEKTQDERLILRNLNDAGCSSTMAETFLQLQHEGKTKQLLSLLNRQRTTLLRRVHTNQNRLDCLDHLIHRLKNELAK
ncbi:MAG: hypothetical protein PHS41_13070 [Victivallaceae bacterium]|nr:hypothetical protein [Victivallaceae bacterium]